LQHQIFSRDLERHCCIIIIIHAAVCAFRDRDEDQVLKMNVKGAKDNKYGGDRKMKEGYDLSIANQNAAAR
jgi:hypothetical protein